MPYTADAAESVRGALARFGALVDRGTDHHLGSDPSLLIGGWDRRE